MKGDGTQFWIQTRTGKKFYPLAPDPNNICIEDIAHSLSNQCRFSGHTRSFYSVAQHSVLVSKYCSDENKFCGLAHDFTEAYLVDLPKPIKWALRNINVYTFDEVEHKIWLAIAEKYRLPKEIPQEVHMVDTLLLTTEARDLMSPLAEGWVFSEANGYPALQEVIEPLSPLEAERLFLSEFLKYRTYS